MEFIESPVPSELVLAVGTQSLAFVREDILSRAAETQKAAFLAESPVEGWGEAICPIPFSDRKGQTHVLRLTGRTLRVEQRMTLFQSARLWAEFRRQLIGLEELRWENLAFGLIDQWERAWASVDSQAEYTILLQEVHPELQPVWQQFLSSGVDERELQKQISDLFPASNPISSERTNRVANKLCSAFRKKQADLAKNELQQRLLLQARSKHDLIGSSPLIRGIRKRIKQSVKSTGPVFLSGPAGIGKQVLGKSMALHAVSKLDQLHTFSASQLSREDLDHIKAILDDYSDSKLAVLISDFDHVAKDVLETLLALMEVASDTVKWIVTCEKSLAEFQQELESKAGSWEQLGWSEIVLTSLASRPEDIIPLAKHFLDQVAGTRKLNLSEGAQRELQSYHWPGEVSELKYVIEQLARSADQSQITADKVRAYCRVADATQVDSADLPLSDATIEFQRAFIRQAIAEAEGNMTEAARRLGLHRTNFYRKMNQLQMTEAGAEKAAEETSDQKTEEAASS